MQEDAARKTTISGSGEVFAAFFIDTNPSNVVFNSYKVVIFTYDPASETHYPFQDIILDYSVLQGYVVGISLNYDGTVLAVQHNGLHYGVQSIYTYDTLSNSYVVT